jgi:glycosyltransferase involved in cell wall biosynthesis
LKRLLFHSYHFPPIGGSGAQRPLKMVRHLHQLGYESVVVTAGGATSDRWAPEDSTLAAELPAGLRVARFPNDDEPSPSSARAAIERWLNLKSTWEDWWIEGSSRLSLRVADGIDLIYVWMQPYTSAKVGAALSRRLGRPWVADLGDPWALDEMLVYPTRIHRRLALKRMRNDLASAAAIVMSTSEAVRRLLEAFPELSGRPVVTIPNGFDGLDFEGEQPIRNDQKFRIVHTGYLHTALGEQHRRRRLMRDVLGGSVPGLEILTRSHVYLVEAINRVLADNPELADILELHLVGITTEADRRVAARCPVAKLHGYVSHSASIEMMRSADLLFLPLHNLPGAQRASIVPGKTYEYLASGTPILAAVPPGDARDILTEAGNAIVTDPDDFEAIASGIRCALERASAGAPAQSPDPSVVARFEYRNLARDLATVFDGVLAEPAQGQLDASTSRRLPAY